MLISVEIRVDVVIVIDSSLDVEIIRVWTEGEEIQTEDGGTIYPTLRARVSPGALIPHVFSKILSNWNQEIAIKRSSLDSRMKCEQVFIKASYEGRHVDLKQSIGEAFAMHGEIKFQMHIGRTVSYERRSFCSVS